MIRFNEQIYIYFFNLLGNNYMKTDFLSKYSFLWLSLALIGIWYLTYSRNEISLDTILFLIPILYLLWQSHVLKETNKLNEQIILKEETEITKELPIICSETTNNIENSKAHIDVNYLLGYIQAFSFDKKLKLKEKLPLKHYTINNNDNILFEIKVNANSYTILAFIYNIHFIQIDIQNIEDITIYKKIITTIMTKEK